MEYNLEVNNLNEESKEGLLRKPERTLVDADFHQEYTIREVKTEQEEMKDFLFTLGCYEGEKVTLLSIVSEQYVIVIKDARYSIDQNLASCIFI